MWPHFKSRLHGGFNSRTREGCDRTLAVESIGVMVSIHAPARGAIRLFSSDHSKKSFNSRTREGCDVGHAARQRHK